MNLSDTTIQMFSYALANSRIEHAGKTLTTVFLTVRPQQLGQWITYMATQLSGFTIVDSAPRRYISYSACENHVLITLQIYADGCVHICFDQCATESDVFARLEPIIEDNLGYFYTGFVTADTMRLLQNFRAAQPGDTSETDSSGDITFTWTSKTGEYRLNMRPKTRNVILTGYRV